MNKPTITDIMALDPSWVEPVPLDQETDRDDEKAPSEDQEKWFTAFWDEVWAKIGHADARKAFFARIKTRADAVVVYRAVREQAPVYRARAEENGRALHPATWLRQERWKDETPAMPGRRPTVVAVDPKALEKQRREVTPDQQSAINATFLAMWRRELHDPRNASDREYREWILRQAPELAKEAKA